MKIAALNNKLITFWEKYRNNILSIILALYTLPPIFSYAPNTGLDGSWVRAVNIAIKKHLVFGTDLIFTYGPLAYLSTRNIQYINSVFLLLADIFSFICFIYIFYKLLSQNKGWFFIIFIAVFYFKADYSEIFFLLFISFSIINLKNGFNNHFETICCAISGVTVFFIKANYGFITFPIMFFLFLFLIIKNRKSFIIFIIAASLVFFVIYANTHISLVGYVENSLPIISNFPEAMLTEIDPSAVYYKSAIIYFIIFSIIILYRIQQLWKDRNFDFANVYAIVVLSLMFYLKYKNGFTRTDHSYGFFLVMPLFIVLTFLFIDYGRSNMAKIVCIFAIIISDYNLPLPHGCEGKSFFYNSFYMPLNNYFITILNKPSPDVLNPEMKISDENLNLIGQSTIDIIPVWISLLQLNNLNYDPRPIIQSYSAYSRGLDSINANHFYISNRPEFVMLRNESIDTRYASWDESVTKATLHLNYKFISFIACNSDTSCFLLLKSKKGIQQFPKFDKLYDKIINIGDTVRFDFADTSPVYMTVDIEYNPFGTFKNIFYQSPLLYMSLFLDNACTARLDYEAIRPIMKGPVLISNLITDNYTLRDFINGNINKNTRIKGFSIHASSSGFKQKIKLSFFKFKNY